jgi:sirohydrochlorin ferrochelatase
MSQHVAARLGLRSVLRGLAESQADVAVHLRTGAELSGRFLRVGEDFAELAEAGCDDGWGSVRQSGRVVLVPFRLLSGVRRG